MRNVLSNLFNEERYIGYLFILPAFVGTLIFIIIPTVFSFGLSFTEWDLLNPIKFVGITNYKELFSDSLFYKIILNTVIYAISTTVFAVIIPLLIANILNMKLKFSEIFKTVYFLPFITPMIVIAIVWEQLLSEGLIPRLISFQPLYSTEWAMPAIIAVSVWKLIGYNTILFLTGFSTLNTEVIESAKTDGAGWFNILRYVTIPMLAPTIFFVVIITAISSFQVFDLIYMMTAGGPLDSTNVLVYSVYQNAFDYFNAGKASAIAYVLFAIVFVLTLIQWKLRSKFVAQESDNN